MLHLEIVSPEGITYKDDVDEVILPTPDGEIAVLTNHIPLFTKISEGEVRIKKGDKEISIAITGGFLEVDKTSLTIIADYAVKAESIEVARAQEAKKRAEKMLEERKEGVDFALIEKDLQRSILELKIAEKVKRKQRV